jgi:prepilin-type N-terminal cleavage/methylation domain-containing protein
MRMKTVGMRDLPDEQGFTLVEVAMALTILALGILAVATMQMNAIHGNRLANEATQAVFLAQTQLEELKSEDLVSGVLNPGAYNDPNNPIVNSTSGRGFFTRSWVVANNTTFSRAITVTVSWPQENPTHSVVLRSITRGGGI